jgi:hypothetical protein
MSPIMWERLGRVTLTRFSTFSMHQNHLAGLIKHRFLPQSFGFSYPRVWELAFLISIWVILLSLVQGTYLENHCPSCSLKWTKMVGVEKQIGGSNIRVVSHRILIPSWMMRGNSFMTSSSLQCWKSCALYHPSKIPEVLLSSFSYVVILEIYFPSLRT